MPHIDGIEMPVYTKVEQKEDHKVSRKASWLKWYRNTRNKALATLGGKCACGKTDPKELHIVGLTIEAREWSQSLFYKRLIDTFREGGDPTKLGKIICIKCRNTGMTLAAMERREANKGTGEFYWIGGQRVEQVRKATGRDKWGHLIIHPRYEDDVIGLLKEE